MGISISRSVLFAAEEPLDIGNRSGLAGTPLILGNDEENPGSKPMQREDSVEQTTALACLRDVTPFPPRHFLALSGQSPNASSSHRASSPSQFPFHPAKVALGIIGSAYLLRLALGIELNLIEPSSPKQDMHFYFQRAYDAACRIGLNYGEVAHIFFTAIQNRANWAKEAKVTAENSKQLYQGYPGLADTVLRLHQLSLQEGITAEEQELLHLNIVLISLAHEVAESIQPSF